MASAMLAVPPSRIGIYVPRELQPKRVHVGNYGECILAGVPSRCPDGKVS